MRLKVARLQIRNVYVAEILLIRGLFLPFRNSFDRSALVVFSQVFAKRSFASALKFLH